MPAILLRLLLIVTLILNGSGAAMASVRMAQQLGPMSDPHAMAVPSDAVMHAAMPDAPDASTHHAAVAHAGPPCHDMPGMADATLAISPDAAATPTAQTQLHDGDAPHHPSPSHCDGGTCQCACLHAAQAMTTLPRVPALAAGASAMPQPAIDVHVDPALPHLIRPPIA